MSKMPSHSTQGLVPLVALVVPSAMVASLPWFTHFAVPKLLVAGVLLAWCAVRMMWGADDRAVREVAGGKSLGLWLLLTALLAGVPACFYLDSRWESLRQGVLEVESLALLGVAFFGPRPRNVIQRMLPFAAVALTTVAAIWAFELMAGSGTGFAAVAGGSTMGNPGLVGELCGVGALLVASGAFASLPGWKRIAYGALAALLALVPLLTGSLTGLGALVLGAGAWCVCLCQRRGRPLLAAGVVLLLALLLGAALLVPEVMQGVQRRFYLYRIAWDVLWQHPFAGGGVGSFARDFLDAQGRFLEVRPEYSGWWSQIGSAHCAWLSLACERGVLAAAAWLSLFGWSLFRLWRSGRAWATGVLVSLLVCYTVSISFETVPLRLLGFAWVGWFAFRRASLAVVVPRVLASGVLVLSLLALASACFITYVDASVARNDIDGALKAAPFHGYARYLRGSALAQAGRMAEAAQELSRAEMDYPSVALKMELGRALYRSGKVAEAEAVWLSVVRWNRIYMPAYANLALLYAETHRPDLAQRYLKRALSLRPSDPRVKAVQRRIRELTPSDREPTPAKK